MKAQIKHCLFTHLKQNKPTWVKTDTISQKQVKRILNKPKRSNLDMVNQVQKRNNLQIEENNGKITLQKAFEEKCRESEQKVTAHSEQIIEKIQTKIIKAVNKKPENDYFEIYDFKCSCRNNHKTLTCRKTGKIIYATQKIAKNELRRIKKKCVNDKSAKKIPCRAYYCEHCGGWHLTSMSLEKYEKLQDGTYVDIQDYEMSVMEKYEENCREKETFKTVMQRKKDKIWEKRSNWVKSFVLQTYFAAEMPLA